MRSNEGKAERLFRASVSAFCALTRPTRMNAAQLDDLTLPLYDQVSPEARRYVAAALSECRRAPLALVRRLAREPLEISAPLLMRSTALADIDLLGLIARHGLAHGRAIRTRGSLNPAIARLIDALEAAPLHHSPAVTEIDGEATLPSEENAMSSSAEPAHPLQDGAAEEVRNRLRAMMAVGGEGKPEPQPRPQTLVGNRDPYERLRETAFTGTAALFQTALADAADISFSQAIPLVLPTRRRSLMLVLRGLGLGAEQAFLIVSALDPAGHPHAETVRLFYETFTLMHPEAGRDEIRRLRADSVAAMVTRPTLTAPARDEAPQRLLKAS